MYYKYYTIYMYMYIHVIHFFFGKVTALGVLFCFALICCLFDLACFFLPSSLLNIYVLYMYCMCAYIHLQCTCICTCISVCVFCCAGIILETDIDFQDSLLPRKKGYLQEVRGWRR